jgi:hypothetical protein
VGKFCILHIFGLGGGCLLLEAEFLEAGEDVADADFGIGQFEELVDGLPAVVVAEEEFELGGYTLTPLLVQYS